MATDEIDMLENSLDWDRNYNSRKPPPASALFTRESYFQYHLFDLLRKAGHVVEVEQGVNHGDYALRWDLGVRTNPSDFVMRRLAIAIECKIKGGSDSFSKALGQCLIYRAAKCCHTSMLAIPSDLYVPCVIESACKEYGIHLVTEQNIVDKVNEIRDTQYE